MEPDLPTGPRTAQQASQPALLSPDGTSSGRPDGPPGPPQLPAGVQETRRCTHCRRTLPVSHFRGIRKQFVQRCQECRLRQRIQRQQSASAIATMSTIARGSNTTANQTFQDAVNAPLPQPLNSSGSGPQTPQGSLVGQQTQLDGGPSLHVLPLRLKRPRLDEGPSPHVLPLRLKHPRLDEGPWSHAPPGSAAAPANLGRLASSSLAGFGGKCRVYAQVWHRALIYHCFRFPGTSRQGL